MNEKEAPVKATWLERWGSAWATSAERWMPDPFIFAILLVFAIFILGMAIQGLNPYELAQCMYKGFWKFLAFAMQMVIILITGYAIAYILGCIAALSGCALGPRMVSRRQC